MRKAFLLYALATIVSPAVGASHYNPSSLEFDQHDGLHSTQHLRSLQEPPNCNNDNVALLSGTILLDFFGRPDRMTTTEVNILSNALQSGYNAVGQCEAPSSRSITSVSLITNLQEIGTNLVSNIPFSLEFRLEGTCLGCPSDSLLLFLSTIESTAVDASSTCPCQDGPPGGLLELNLVDTINSAISNRELQPISSFTGLAEIVDQESCPEAMTFSSNVIVDFLSCQSAEELDESTLATLATLFEATYNNLNGLNTEQCDLHFRQAANVGVSVGDSTFSAGDVQPIPLGSTCTNQFALRFFIEASCRNCDDSSPAAMTLFDRIEESSQVTSSLVALTTARRLMWEDNNERELQESACRCPASPVIRSPTELEMIVGFQAAIAQVSLSVIERVLDVIEVEPAECSGEVSTYTTEVEVEFATNTEVVSQDVLDLLAATFRNSYNTLSNRFCDPQFRRVDSVEAVQEPQGGRRVQSFFPNSASNFTFVLPDFTLSIVIKFYLSISGYCSKCSTESAIFNDAARRRHLLHSTDSPTAFDYGSAGIGDVGSTTSRGRWVQEAGQCFCSSVNVVDGAPTDREFTQQYQQDVQTALSGKGDAGKGAIAGVTQLTPNIDGPRPKREACATVDDCVEGVTGDLCVANQCIFDGTPQMTLSWTGDDDYDLSVTTPAGDVIFHGNRYDPDSRGVFDTEFVQTVGGSHVESIYFPLSGTAPGGIYIIKVEQFTARGDSDQWTLEVDGGKNGSGLSQTGSGTSGGIMYNLQDKGPPSTCNLSDPTISCCKRMDCPTFKERCALSQCIQDGQPRITLSWFGNDNLQLYVITPGGQTLSLLSPTDPASEGIYQDDSNRAATESVFHVQNVYFPRNGQSPNGEYRFYVQSLEQKGISDPWGLQAFVGRGQTDYFGSGTSDTFRILKFPPGTGDNESPCRRGEGIECCGKQDCNIGGSSDWLCVQSTCITDGHPRFTLSWNGDDDLDIYVVTPNGERIDWDHAASTDGGVLQPDSNPDSKLMHVEAITFQKDNAPIGMYKFGANLWDQRGNSLDEWTLTLTIDEIEVASYTSLGTSEVLEYDYDGLTVATPKPPSVGICFSGDTSVTTRDKGVVPMKEIEVGDWVLSARNGFEPIYSFGHRHETMKATYLRILPFGLEISGKHMVFTSNGDEGRHRRAIPASMLKVGDELFFQNWQEESKIKITSIQTVQRAGMYAPFTSSGTIVVNDVVASTYVSFQDAEHLHLGGIQTPLTYQWLAHTFQFPHRLWCLHQGSGCSRHDESYSSDGISMWVYRPLLVTQWLLEQEHQGAGATVAFMVLFPVVCLLGISSLTETLILSVHENRAIFIICVSVILSLLVGCCRWLYDPKRMRIAS